VSDCLFCRIARKEIPSAAVWDDDEVYAFDDIAPQAPTHVLVIPKQHLASLAEAGAGQAPLLGRLLGAAAEIAERRGLRDFRTVINNGAGAGQSVFHLHLHLLGGRPFLWPPG